MLATLTQINSIAVISREFSKSFETIKNVSSFRNISDIITSGKNTGGCSVFSLKKKNFAIVVSEAATGRVLWKKVSLEISHNSQENTCARVSFSIRWQAADYKFIKKETLAQIFSYELREISKNFFSIEHLPMTASVVS